MRLPDAPDRYDRANEQELRRLVEGFLTRIEQQFAAWVAATGTADRTTFDTAAVTLPQLAQRVKAMLDDLLGTPNA